MLPVHAKSSFMISEPEKLKPEIWSETWKNQLWLTREAAGTQKRWLWMQSLGDTTIYFEAGQEK